MTETFKTEIQPNHAENFRLRLNGAISHLTSWEQQFQNANDEQKILNFDDLGTNLHTDPEINLSHLEDPGEQLLFIQLLDLFVLKHRIGEKNRILSEQIANRPKENRVIGFLAALGNGKTTIAQDFADDLNTNLFTREPYVENPYRAKSQQDKSYMLRSQLYFLFSNIFADIHAHLQPGVMISDSSTLTDIFMWVETYRQMGLLSEEEYETYNQLVDLLKPVIPKPDLLIGLLPTSINDLKKGVEERIKAKPEERESEKVFLENDNLEKQVKVVEGLLKTIPEQWNVPILTMIVNPIKIYEEQNYDLIYEIRRELGILGDWLNPQPEQVVDKATRILARSKKGQIIVIHSKSMFSGKTTAQCLLAERLGINQVLVFQPAAALRYPDQEGAVISRNGLKIDAKTVKRNDLKAVLRDIKKYNIRPENFPHIFIDEIMLFIGQKDKAQEAIEVLEKLRQMGFNLVIDGIDYTFQEEPFTFMHDLLREARKNDNWHQIETSTHCRYCSQPAHGTRLWLINPDGSRKIAPYGFNFVHPGDTEFEPVCCDKHPSCVDQPSNFHRQELPT